MFQKFRGTIDQLLVYRTILKNYTSRETVFTVTWIYFKSNLRCDSLFQDREMLRDSPCITGSIRCLISKITKKWKTTLKEGGTDHGNISMKRGIFQGDSFSSLSLLIGLISLSFVLRNVKGVCTFAMKRQLLTSSY